MGSLIVVPRVPGLRPAAAERDADPVTDGLHELADALRDYRRVLAESIRPAMAGLAEVERIIGAPEVKEALAAEPGGEAQLAGIAKANEERAAGLERAKNATERMGAVADELTALGDRLR